MPSYPISRRALRASALALVIGAGLTGPVALATTAGAAVSSATATATATAAVNEYDWQLTYTAATHRVNKVTIAESYTSGHEAITYVIDDVVPIRAGHGCSYPVGADHTRVSCTVVALESQDPYAALEMSLGDGNDTVTSRNATGQVYYLNRIDLGSGNDRLTDNTGLDGNEVVGGTGNDTITVGKLASVLAGDGNDTVNAGGGDNIVNAGKGNDVLRGAAAGQILNGDDGNDTIYGGTGDDSLYGGTGNDVLYGNSGADKLYGNSGNDKLYGGPGRDTLSGGPGRNIVHQD
ncbi:calcium-binding protein [Streptomyces sp. NPDC048448]|uniref:calcium-binding protein n=1 Tax=Streptomyces sp. NPDC048448 TaxID=3365554 RepID=UPI003723FADF